MAATATRKPKSSVRIQPVGDRIVARRDESETTTAGGLVLPDSAKDKPTRGVVVSVGTGRLLKDGTRSKSQLKAGDRILFTSYGPDEIRLDDDDLLLMREEDVLAIID